MNSKLGNAFVLLLLLGAVIAFALLQENYALTDNVARRWWAVGLAVLYVAISGWFLKHRQRKATVNVDADGTLVVFASQTGFAEQLAVQTAAQIADATAIGMDKLTNAQLARAKRSLWIVSTTGEGDPPDMALPFLNQQDNIRLDGHPFALLALGDRSYEQYCAFGHAMNQWLQERGATPTQALIEVNNADELALEEWQKSLGLASLSLESAPFEQWVIARRQLMNPGSLGWPTYLISLRPQGGLPNWSGGDIAQIAQWQGNAELDASQWREYSIASIPDGGSLDVLVRLTHRENGEYGLISGLLCRELHEGDAVALRIRENPSFHVPADGRPMLLIGNGTGIAGLRSLLQTRIHRKEHRNWLIFGERQRDKDFYFEDELHAWHAAGQLQELDATFSRDAANSYVYHVLEDNAEAVRAWVADGADIFVCGSRASMGADVDRVLRDILGSERVDQLIRDNRYRRDVY